MDESQENSKDNDDIDAAQTSSASISNQMFLPADLTICTQVLALLGDGKARIDVLTRKVSEDPALVIEILKATNSVKMSSGKSPSVSLGQSLIALGVQSTTDIVKAVAERDSMNLSDDVDELYADFRTTAVTIANLAGMIAESVDRNLTPSAYVGGLFLFVGDMLTVVQIQDRYVQLQEQFQARSKINFRLQQDLGINVDANGIKFLEQSGIPDRIISVINRDAILTNEESALLRAIVFSAGEFFEAFESDKLDKFAPDKKIPTRSSIRMLGLAERPYASLYEKINKYLNSGLATAVNLVEEEAPASSDSEEDSALSSSETQNSDPDTQIIEQPLEFDSAQSANAPVIKDEDGSVESRAEELTEQSETISPQSVAKQDDEIPPEIVISPKRKDPFEDTLRMLGLFKDPNPPPPVKLEETNQVESVEASDDELDELPPLELPDAAPLAPKLHQLVHQMCDRLLDSIQDYEDSSELLSCLADELVSKGPFKRAALISIASDKKSAKVLRACGTDIVEGNQIQITNNLHPLVRTGSHVVTLNQRAGENSSFGAKSFAIAPVINSGTSILKIYVDPGTDSMMNLVERRVFRVVIDKLNAILQNSPADLTTLD